MNKRTRKELSERLDAVDWNFPGSATPPYSVHALHWFPGNFIPQIPSFLIQLLSKPGSVVFDPFCGSGTTPIEALQLNRRAYASDVNSASIHVTLGKIAMLTDPTVETHLRSVRHELLLDLEIATKKRPAASIGLVTELKKWFHPQTFDQLLGIWEMVQKIAHQPTKQALELLFTDTLFACASPGAALTKTGKRRRHHWGWVADNVIPTLKYPHSALEFFRKRVHHAICVVEQADDRSETFFSVKREDARDLSLSDGTVDLIVTSPPYVAMIDYTLANRLTYDWMGWSLPTEIAAELGARRFRKRPQALSEYLQGLEAACAEMTRVLKSGAYCAIVIGASRAFPTAVNMAVQMFSKHLEKIWGPTPRVATRRRVAERLGTSPMEFICVFQKL